MTLSARDTPNCWGSNTSSIVHSRPKSVREEETGRSLQANIRRANHCNPNEDRKVRRHETCPGSPQNDVTKAQRRRGQCVEFRALRVLQAVLHAMHMTHIARDLGGVGLSKSPSQSGAKR